MKKLLLMTIALLALGATIASAQNGSFNLAWGGSCRIAAVNAAQDNQSSTIGGVPCNDPTDPMGASPTRTLTASFQNYQTLPDFSGTTTKIEITDLTGPYAANSIWNFQGTCNAGALTAKATVGTVLNCTNPYAGDINGQGNFTNVALTSPSMFTYINNRVRNSTVAPLNAPTGGGFTADQLVLDLDSGLQTQSCPGCDDHLDFGVRSIQYFSPGTTLNCDKFQLKGCVGWNDAVGAACPSGVTANQRSTWGSVKALYR